MSPARKKQLVITTAFMGSIVLLVGVYLIIVRVKFLSSATSLDAPIVAVNREHVSKGKGSVLAYVPFVEVLDGKGMRISLRVDTFDEKPSYQIGGTMHVSCNLERGCVEDSFMAKWGDGVIDLLLALVFFAPLLYYVFSRQMNKSRSRLAYSEPYA